MLAIDLIAVAHALGEVAEYFGAFRAADSHLVVNRRMASVDGRGIGYDAVGQRFHIVMAGLVPAIPVPKSAALGLIGIAGTDPRIKSGEVMT